MDQSDFEIKRALDCYFRSQFELQNEIVKHLQSIEKQQRALLAVFGAAAREIGK